MKYNLIACGGTFDLLHRGHREFLKRILEQADNLILGLTSDEYIQKYKPNKEVASFDTRKKDLINFFKEIEAEKRVEIVKIDDIFGPLLNPQFNADGIAVTPKLRKIAEHINRERIKIGLKPLEILELPEVLADDGKVISSSRVRKGEIDREGKLQVAKGLKML